MDLLFYVAIDTLFLVTVKHFTEAQIVLLTTISTAAGVALRIPLLWLMKKIGNTATIRIGSVCLVLSAALITVFSNFWIICLGRCFRSLTIAINDSALLPLCSAAGDQCPIDLVRWVEPESELNDPNCKRVNPPKRKADPSMFDLAGIRKVGKRIVNEIIDTWEEGLDEIQSEVEFGHRVVNMHLPIRRVTLSDVKKAREDIQTYLSDKEEVDYNDVARLQVYLGILRRFEIQDKLDTLTAEAHIIRMGTIAIATNPFELFLNYGNQIKARSAAEQTFLVQLANGSEGHLPTAKAEAGGHYSAFVASGQVGHIGGEQLVRETLQNIREIF